MLGWGVFVFGVLMFLMGFYLLKKGVVSESWPHTEGEILISEQTVSRGIHGNSYNFLVLYEYHVDGCKYTSDFLSYKMDTSDKSSLYRSRYPKGSKVPVYYDPSNPKNAVLETGVGQSLYRN